MSFNQIDRIGFNYIRCAVDFKINSLQKERVTTHIPVTRDTGPDSKRADVPLARLIPGIELLTVIFVLRSIQVER